MNPEIVVSEIDPITYEIKDNPNQNLKKSLEKYDFKKLRDNLYFEAAEPRFNAYVDLKNVKFDLFSKVCKNKIRNAKRKGLYLEKGTIDDLDTLAKMGSSDVSYYKKLYSIFSKPSRLTPRKSAFCTFRFSFRNLSKCNLSFGAFL